MDPKPTNGSASPFVWVLLGKRRGDNAQSLRLAEALGWPTQCFQLTFNPLFLCSNRLLNRSQASLQSAEPELVPPWPDLVIAVGRRTVPVARWIQAQGEGHPRLIHLGRPRAPLNWFDHIVTTPQYALPPRRHITHLPLPLGQVTAQGLRRAAAEWRHRLQGLPRPRIAVLVGGPSRSVRLGRQEAYRIVQVARDQLPGQGGSLLISTAPRTPPVVADLLEHELPEPHLLYRWDRLRGSDNPYLGYLAWADEAIVTQDSVSTLADSVAANLPTLVVDLPERLEGHWAAIQHSPLGSRLLGRLERGGLVTPAPDLRALRKELIHLEMAHPRSQGFEVNPEVTRLQEAALHRALIAIRALMKAPAPKSSPTILSTPSS